MNHGPGNVHLPTTERLPLSSYAVAHLDEIPEQNDGRCPYRPVRHHLGITAFGATAWTGHAAGDRIINEHDESDEPGNEELYVVMRGHAVFELDGERVDAPRGTMVFAPAGVKRTAFAEEAETTIVVVGASAGKAYTPGGWELWAPFVADYQAGKHAEVAERLRELVDSGTEYPMLVYNLACLESLTGQKEDALDHLRRALEQHDDLRNLAKTDSDLDAIRDEPAFKELVGA